MKRTETIKKNYEFRRLYAKGKCAVNGFVAVYARTSRRPGCRVGFTVSTKLGKAVRRNRVRRRLREIYRLHEMRFVPGAELVIVARSRAVTASYRQLERAVLSAAEKLGVVQEETQ